MWHFCILLTLSLGVASGTTQKVIKCNAENEVYDPCPLARPLTCDQMKNPPVCKPNQSCKPTCRCKEGFVYNDVGRCVQISDCMSCDRPNEFFDCGLPCDRTCDNLDTKCDVNDASCTKMCYCKKGFARDENDDCIPVTKCKCPKCRDPNAEFRKQKTCEKICFREPDCSSKGAPGCQCKKGYVRTSKTDNICIHHTDCIDERCPGKYQVYKYCSSICPNICPGPDGILICGDGKGCGPPGCDCIPGYLKTNGVCVLPKDCPPIICDRPNEVFSKVGETVSETCDSILKIGPPIIRQTDKPNPRCLCKKGYVRGRDLRCVLAKNCGRCKKPNEEYTDCGPAADPTCEKPFPSDSSACVEGCFCKSGFVRHNSQCIHEYSCPK